MAAVYTFIIDSENNVLFVWNLKLDLEQSI